MRLATFNIAHGRGLEDGHGGTDRLVSACASLDADIMCLQEVDRWQARSGGVDQAAEVARGTGAVAWRFEPALVGEPGATWRAAADGDEAVGEERTAGYGVAIVSRLPVRAWHVLRLPAAKVRSPVAVPRSHAGRPRWGVILLPDEPRVVLAAELDGPDGPWLVATTHLSFVPGWNVAQLRRATRTLAAHGAGRPGRRGGAPCVLLGDLNVPGPVPGWASGWSALARVRTFPADRPSMQLDHALGRGRLPRVTGAASRRLPLSDHRALVVDLTSG